MRLTWLKALLMGAWVFCAWAGEAGHVRLRVQDSPLAGSQFHALESCFARIRLGDVLELRREPNNAHDGLAIQVWWQDCWLGYVPRRENRVIAAALDRGEVLVARVTRLTPDGNPWLRLRFAVFVEL